MPQSLATIYVHIVFSTRHRAPFLHDETVRNSLHAYLGGILRNDQNQPLGIGGTEDHVHVLASLAKTASVADVVRVLKCNSSSWVKDRCPGFAWQSGYGAFTLGPRDLAAAQRYVADQIEHHRVLTFQDEFRKLLEEHDVAWNERYVWD
jgi:putative transposase